MTFLYRKWNKPLILEKDKINFIKFGSSKELYELTSDLVNDDINDSIFVIKEVEDSKALCIASNI